MTTSSGNQVVVVKQGSSSGGTSQIVIPTEAQDPTASRSSNSTSPITNPPIVSRQVPSLQPLPVDPLFATRDIGDYDWTPDGKRLVLVTNLSGRANLWAADVNGVGWPQQLTFGHDRVDSPRVSPDGKVVLYTADPANDERRDVFLLPLGGGTPANLTRTPAADEQEPTWSPDGTKLAYTADADGRGGRQIYLLDMLNNLPVPPARRLTNSVMAFQTPIFSPNGAHLLATRLRSAKDSSLVLIDLKTGTEKELTPHEGEQRWHGMAFSPDGKRVLATGDISGFSQVATVDLESLAITWVTQGSGEGLAQAWSSKEERIAWITNREGNFHIHSAPPKPGSRSTVLRIRKGQIDSARFSPDGRFLAFRYAGSMRARDLWMYDLTRHVARQVTFSMVSGVRPEHLVDPITVHYQAFDERYISAFLYVPHNLDSKTRRPAIVWVHDGPSAQFQNGFRPAIQFLVNRGFVVIVPNYRGSTGFGRSFEDLNDLDWGGGDVQDLVEAARFLSTISYVDSSRISILGTGYGGYLALSALVRAPAVWAAGIDISGFFDLNQVWQRARDEEKQAMSQELGKPEERPALWRDRSPVHFLSNLRAPLLLVQGNLDRRVTEDEMQAVLNRLRQLNAMVEYRRYQNERAVFDSWQNRVDLYLMVADFLNRQLALGAAPPTDASKPGQDVSSRPATPDMNTDDLRLTSTAGAAASSPSSAAASPEKPAVPGGPGDDPEPSSADPVPPDANGPEPLQPFLEPPGADELEGEEPDWQDPRGQPGKLEPTPSSPRP